MFISAYLWYGVVWYGMVMVWLWYGVVLLWYGMVWCGRVWLLTENKIYLFKINHSIKCDIKWPRDVLICKAIIQDLFSYFEWSFGVIFPGHMITFIVRIIILDSTKYGATSE